MLERQTSGAVVYYASPLLERLGVPHGFSTRIGGVSASPFDTMNLGNPSGCATQDATGHIEENYRRLQQAIAAPSRRRCWVHQVHADRVAHADDPSYTADERADALISGDPCKLLSVRTADCVPILLAANDGRLAAAVHAGWRGVVANVLSATLQSLRAAGADIDSIVAAIGPCIGSDAFEVDDEVFQQLVLALGSSAPIRPGRPGKWHADLSQACRMQLESAGVRPKGIDLSDRCTVRDREEFFSHRRDNGITGRMAALIGPARSPGAAS